MTRLPYDEEVGGIIAAGKGVCGEIQPADSGGYRRRAFTPRGCDAPDGTGRGWRAGGHPVRDHRGMRRADRLQAGVYPREEGRYRHHQESGGNAGTGDQQPVPGTMGSGASGEASNTAISVWSTATRRRSPTASPRRLVNAAEGDVDQALLFCGSNAYRATKIETVDEVIQELVGEA